MNASAKWMCCANSEHDKDDEETKVIMQNCSGSQKIPTIAEPPPRYEISITKILPITEYLQI